MSPERDLISGAAQVPGYPKYYVTRTGEVFSYSHGMLSPVSLRLYGGETPKSRHYTFIYQAGRRKMIHVDEFVALAFVPVECSKSGSHEVVHKDGNLSLDHADNLKWVRRKYEPRARPAGRPKEGKSPLTEEDVYLIRFLYDHGLEKITEICELFPRVSYSSVSKIVLRLFWKHLHGYGPYKKTAGT